LEKKLGKYLTTLLVIILVGLALSRLSNLREGSLPTAHRSRIMMDTVVSVRIYKGDGPDQVDEFAEAAFAEMERLEGMLSAWVSTSDINRINDAAGGKPITVSPDTWQVILYTQELSRQTEGAFDITIGAVMRLWDFQSPEAQVPDETAIQRSLLLVEPHQLLLDTVNVKVGLRRRGAAVDLGGAAKGYAVDRAIAILKEHGVKAAMVDAGGDIGLLGRKSGGEAWKIGIRHPRLPGEIIEILQVDSGAVATSGDYERFFLQDNVRYHHILDPGTGMPARGAVSATILAKTALEADVLATAVFVLGPEKGLGLIERLGGVEGIIYAEGPEGLQRWASSGCP
jgi:thiamine biosynthesis lipoprotein